MLLFSTEMTNEINSRVDSNITTDAPPHLTPASVQLHTALFFHITNIFIILVFDKIYKYNNKHIFDYKNISQKFKNISRVLTRLTRLGAARARACACWSTWTGSARTATCSTGTRTSTRCAGAGFIYISTLSTYLQYLHICIIYTLLWFLAKLFSLTLIDHSKINY